jgi:hypothetical protein
MPDKPDLPQTPAVQASDANTEVILDRIATSDRNTIDRIKASDTHTNEALGAHETRDQERFTEQATALQASTKGLNGALTELTREVRITNGGLSAVKQEVVIIKDRAEQIAQKKAFWLSWKQGIVLTLISGGGVWIVHLIVK